MSDPILTDQAQPLFYFFLRKTGSPADAEDLTSEVLLAWLNARQREQTIPHPHAWLWRVARNRYAAWARARRRESVRLDPQDALCCEIADDTDFVAETIRAEALSLLRRELAFIREEHRALILAHYIRGERLQDIAAHLGMPLGTIKAKLSRCRTKIREGMEMARNFGPRSYSPENMDFVTSGHQPTDLPNRAMERRISVNILLEASENPLTIEELSMALGVAAPYMEDEVRLLVDATLMKRVGDRYVTDFYIMPRETAVLLRQALRGESPAHSAAVKAIALQTLPLLRQLCPDVANRPDSDLLWWLLPWVHETALFAEPRYISDLPERACGPQETWGIVGFEELSAPEPELCFMGRRTCQHIGGLSGIYNYEHECKAMWRRIGPMNQKQAQLLLSLLHRECDLQSLSAAEQETWQTLEGRYAHAEGSRAIMDVITLTLEGRHSLHQAITAHPAFPALKKAASTAFDHLTALLKPGMGDTLRHQLDYVASSELLNLRMMVLNDCLADGTLTLPDDPAHSTIGIWLELR